MMVDRFSPELTLHLLFLCCVEITRQDCFLTRSAAVMEAGVFLAQFFSGFGCAKFSEKSYGYSKRIN